MSIVPGPDSGPDDEAATPMRVSRRRLLAGVGALAAAGVVTLGGIALVGGSTKGALPSALAANLARLPGVEHLRAIGEAVVEAEVLHSPVGVLAVIVAPAGVADPVGWCTGSEPTALRDHVADAAELDFTSGAVLEVDGWRLSRTEAALGALVALS